MKADLEKIKTISTSYFTFNFFLEEILRTLKKGISDNFPVEIKRGCKLGVNVRFSKHISDLLEEKNYTGIELTKRLNQSQKIIDEIKDECTYFLSEANKTSILYDDVTVYFKNKNLVPLSEIKNSDFLEKHDVDWNPRSFTLNLGGRRLSKVKFDVFNRGYCYIEYDKEGSNLIYPIIRFEKGKRNTRIYLDKSAMVNGDHSSATRYIKEKINTLENRIPKISIKP